MQEPSVLSLYHPSIGGFQLIKTQLGTVIEALGPAYHSKAWDLAQSTTEEAREVAFWKTLRFLKIHIFQIINYKKGAMRNIETSAGI